MIFAIAFLLVSNAKRIIKSLNKNSIFTKNFKYFCQKNVQIVDIFKDYKAVIPVSCILEHVLYAMLL